MVSLSRQVELTRRGSIESGVLLVDMNFSGIEQLCKDVTFAYDQGYLYLTEQFDRMAELLGKGLEQMGELAEAEGTSTDSHALQEAENEK